MSHLEAPKCQSSQSGLRYFQKVNNKVSDECTIIQSKYKINYLNNKFNGEITKLTSGQKQVSPKIRKVV